MIELATYLYIKVQKRMKIYKKNNLDELINDLKNNEIVAFPTETVFGLGIIASSEANYLKMVNIKKRPPEKPFTLMCSSIEMAARYVEVSDIAKKVLNKFTPGPITLILPKKENVPSFIDLNSGFVGIRIPKNSEVLEVISKIDMPLMVPSANISGQEPIKEQQGIIETFNGKISGVLEGECESNTPSTIVKIDKDTIILIRRGEISLEEIMESAK